MFAAWASLGNLAVAFFVVLGATIAKQSLGGAGAWAIIISSLSAGSVLGSLAALHLRPGRPLCVAAIGLGALALPNAALAVSLPASAVAACALFAGAGIMLANTLWETALQRHIPAAALSRVSAYDWFGSMAFAPVGYAIAGPIGAAVGLATALWVIAAFFAASGPLVAALPSIRQLNGRGRLPAEKTAAPLFS